MSNSKSPQEPTEEDKKGQLIWARIAQMIGFNELAKSHERLGDKVYFRLCRDILHDVHVAEGNNPLFAPKDEPLVTIEVPGEMRRTIEFGPSDIEAMRVAVAEYDRKQQGG